MNLDWRRLWDFLQAHEGIAYNSDLKRKFTLAGRAALRELSKQLEETGKVTNCKIDYNKGGIAVSGDFHLRGDFKDGGAFDLFFNLDGFSRYYTYRKTTSQKDYTGGHNINLRFEADLPDVMRAILLLQGAKHAMPEVQI